MIQKLAVKSEQIFVGAENDVDTLQRDLFFFKKICKQLFDESPVAERKRAEEVKAYRGARVCHFLIS